MYTKDESELEKVDDKSQEEPQKADNEETTKSNETVEKEKPYVPPPPYKPKIQYPQRLSKSKNKGQFKKFIKLLKQLHITLPFTEAIT